MNKIDLNAIISSTPKNHPDGDYTYWKDMMKEAIHQALVLGSNAVVEELTSSTDLNVGQITNAARAVLNIEKVIV